MKDMSVVTVSHDLGNYTCAAWPGSEEKEARRVGLALGFDGRGRVKIDRFEFIGIQHPIHGGCWVPQKVKRYGHR